MLVRVAGAFLEPLSSKPLLGASLSAFPDPPRNLLRSRRQPRFSFSALLSFSIFIFFLYRLGAFEPAAPPAPGTRATVSFDSLEVFTEGGGGRLLSAGWVFALARAVNPALANGRR